MCNWDVHYQALWVYYITWGTKASFGVIWPCIRMILLLVNFIKPYQIKGTDIIAWFVDISWALYVIGTFSMVTDGCRPWAPNIHAGLIACLFLAIWYVVFYTLHFLIVMIIIQQNERSLNDEYQDIASSYIKVDHETESVEGDVKFAFGKQEKPTEDEDKKNQKRVTILPPIDDTFTIAEGATLFEDVLGNDTDAQGDALSILNGAGAAPATQITVTSAGGREGNAFFAPSGALNFAFDQNGTGLSQRFLFARQQI